MSLEAYRRHAKEVDNSIASDVPFSFGPRGRTCELRTSRFKQVVNGLAKASFEHDLVSWWMHCVYIRPCAHAAVIQSCRRPPHAPT
jgi:hypothetical protein